MTRKADVFEKLDYADKRFNDLADALHSAGMEADQVKFLSSIASDIVAACREVFDYCALDITETHIAPIDAQVAAKLRSGRLKCYFPFYKNQLLKADSPFSKLKVHCRPLHDLLFSIAAAIEHKTVRPNTILNYSTLSEMSELVNKKKHDRLVRIESGESNTLFAKSHNVQLMMDLDEQKGISRIGLPGNSSHRVGAQYLFAENKRKVLEFSLACRVLSRLIMNDIYGKFLS